MRGATPQALGNGRYELSEFISKGGMGAVYRARDVELDRWVAVKCLLDVAKVGSRELAVKEARTLASLSHANIMRVFDILTVGDQVWIVSEWLEGRCLAQLPMPLPPGCVLAIMTQVYDALAAAHTAQVVHRDIKPSNVMIGNDGRVTLIDFGVAYAPGSSTGETLAGSLRYTDPRILEGEPPDALSDLFSAALLLVELMTGETVLPDLAPLPLYRHIKKNLDGRLDLLLDGAYPPLTALARKFTGSLRTDPGLTQVEPAAAREAALLAHDILSRLTRKTPELYLATGMCQGSVADADADRVITAETDAALASALLTPKQKASWIAFKAATEQAAGRPSKAHVEPPRRGHSDRRAHLIAEITRRRNFAFTVGLASFVFASLVLWAKADSFISPEGRLPLVDQPVTAATQYTHLGPTRESKLDGTTHPYDDRSIGVAANAGQGSGLSDAPAALLKAPPVGAADLAPAGPSDAKDGLVPVLLVADAWANVIVDGKDVGRLPQAAPFKLAPGRHALMLTNPSTEPLATEITVQAGTPVRLHFHLEPKITARTIRLGKPGRLYVDGKDHGVVTEKTVSLAYGTHRVWVRRAGESDKALSIALGPDSPAEIVLE